MNKEQLLKTVRTEKDFSKWKQDWFLSVPKCKDFRCIHELMSCGIVFICGDCSIFETFRKGYWGCVCDFVCCMDCMRRFECKMTDEYKEHPKKEGGEINMSEIGQDYDDDVGYNPKRGEKTMRLKKEEKICPLCCGNRFYKCPRCEGTGKVKK